MNSNFLLVSRLQSGEASKISHFCRNANNVLRKAMGANVWQRSSEKLNTVSLSNNKIRRRVDDMAENILAQVVEEVRSSPFKFYLPFDESADIRTVRFYSDSFATCT